MKIDPELNPWMTTPALVAVMETLALRGVTARFVGGAVRDSLLGKDVQDVDIAADKPPVETAEALQSAGFKIVPTGIDHGTIMVVAEGKGYEITSLRRDVETDGRRAVVSYTDDWDMDANRRDFTINALYADTSGRIYDYVGGIEDIKDRRLRFIGRVEDRIKEDVLRILRYFRFIAQLGFTSPLDENALLACRNAAPLLRTLSAERLWKELTRLLTGQEAVFAVRLMADNGILEAFLPAATEIDRWARFVTLAPESKAICRLCSLLKGGHEEVSLRLRLSRKEKEGLVACGKLSALVGNIRTQGELRQLLFGFGEEDVRCALLIQSAADGVDRTALMETVDVWENPVFPLSGRDLVILGIKEGPKIGAILKETEKWWREKDFKPTREACLNNLKERL